MIYLIIHRTYELNLTVQAYPTKAAFQAAVKRFQSCWSNDKEADVSGDFITHEIPYSRSKKQLCYNITMRAGDTDEVHQAQQQTQGQQS